jgi:hypothetical protein
MADTGQFDSRFLQLVEGAGELLSLVVLVQADVYDEAGSDRPVFQFDLPDWFFHRLSSPFIAVYCGGKAADLDAESGSIPKT